MDDPLNEMMTGNAVGQSGGFSSKSDAAGPVAGYDKKLKKPTILARGRMPGARKRWSMKEETVDEGIRLKSFGEFKDGIKSAGERLNRSVVQPATRFIKDRLPKSDSSPSTSSNDGRRATGGLHGVGTKADNKGAVKLKVQNDPALDTINRSAQMSTKKSHPSWWSQKGPSGTAWYGQQQFRRDLTK
jgi:hypothetical protein